MGQVTPLDAWLAQQPLSVRALAREFPFRMKVEGFGRPGWVVSWSAEGELVLSACDPGPEWLRATIEGVRWIEAKALRGMKR